MAEITTNAEAVNNATDPSVGGVTNYDQAELSKAELESRKQEYEVAISGYEREIRNSNLNIQEMQQNLLDPNLSPRQRALLEAGIQENQANIATNTDNYLRVSTDLANVNDQLAADNQIIESTDASTTNNPASIEDPFEAARLQREQDFNTPVSDADLTTPADAVDEDPFEAARLRREEDYNTAVNEAGLNNAEVIANAEAVQGQALANQARTQQAIRNLRKNKASQTDWRVRLSLAPGSTYLYNDKNPGILFPLSAQGGTDGVIFPYTPTIETAYKANYQPYDLTHSNYRGYFYQNSYVDSVNLRCTFTAQDTDEANYLLAVIHFFRSATKMFYGQDAQRGSPPPLVYLSGLGDFQFQEHPCVISQFNYTLPADVDYIRAGAPLSNGTNLLNNRTRTTIGSNPLSFAINRLLNNALKKGAEPSPLTVGNLPEGVTYVPTKIEISISLLPMQSRQQVSTQFSLKAFGQGNLLKGGFW